MITPRTLSTLESVLNRSLKETGTLPEDDRLELVRQSAASNTTSETHRLLVLTISSYAFRIVALFEFQIDERAEVHFAKLFRSEEDRLTGQHLGDALSEYVNMVCGTINRLISSPTRQTGMSTPFGLETTCMAHIQKIKPEETLAFKATFSGGVHLDIVLCLCTAGNSTLDIEANIETQEESTSGELELF